MGVLWLALCFLTGMPGVGQTAPDELSQALASVKAGTPECEKCLFFGVPIENEPANRLLPHHRLFSVSTLDLVPSPIWTVAVSAKPEAFLLEARDLSAWNQMIQAEKLNLSSSEELTLFARVFLRLNSPHSLYIPTLTKAEQSQIQHDGRKVHRQGVHIVKNQGRVGLAFYAKSLGGALERWSLLLENNGQIIKAENKTFP